MRLRDLPFDLIVGAIRKIRKTDRFTVPWGNHDNILINSKPRDIEDYLRNEENFEGMLLAYNYEGEDFNLRLPYGLDSEGKQLELHIRGKEREKKQTEVIAHLERSRYEHKEDHIKEIGFSWEKGTDEMVKLFEDSPFDIKEYNL